MVFSDESAYELGGGTCPSVSFDLPTSNTEYSIKDRLLLIGKDLPQTRADTPFARITLLEIRDDALKGDELYNRLEKIKFTKYRVSPEGYMLRTAVGGKEKVRLSKDAAAHSSFSQIGSAYLKVYKLLPFVNRVTIVFFTGEDPLFPRLQELGRKKAEITETVDHILKGMLLNDCDNCSVKTLCDEVEGLRRLHQTV